MFTFNAQYNVNGTANVLLFVSRTIVISQELFESRNVSLEDVSNNVQEKGRCVQCSISSFELLENLEDQEAAYPAEPEKIRYSANICV